MHTPPERAGIPEVPDLDLILPPARSASPLAGRAATSSGTPSARPDPFGASAFDEDDAPGLALELGESPEIAGGVGAPPLLGALPGASFDADFGDGFVSTRELVAERATSAAPSPADTRPWPTGVAPERATLALDPVEIRLAAGFGDPPGAAGAPLYALRTWGRLRALRPRVAERAHALATGERARDEALAAMFAGVRPALARDQRLARLLDPVSEQERLAAERDAGLGKLDSDHQSRLAELDAERGALGRERSLAEQRGAALETELGQREEAYRRVEARWKRLGIEARAPRQRVEQARAAGAPPPEDAQAQLSALEARAAAQEPEVRASRAERDRVASLSDGVRQELAALAARGRELDTRERALGQAYQSERSVRSQATEAARDAAREAAAAVAREVLRMRGGVPVPEAELEALRAHDARVAELTRAHEQALRMLDAHDARAYALGWRIVAAAVAALTLVLAWAIAR